jgi:hypothetical protein
MATLNANITQTIHDFDEIRYAIIEKGVDVLEGTPTSEYAEKIKEIESQPFYTQNYVVENGVMTGASIELSQDVVANIPDGVIELNGVAPSPPDYEHKLQGFTANRLITKFIMPDTVVRLNDAPEHTTAGVFASCINLNISNSVFSANLNYIGKNAFMSCKSNETFYAPDGVVTYGEYAFSSLYGNRVFVCGEGLQTLDDYAINTIGTEIVVLPTSIMFIGFNCFSDSHITDVYYRGSQADWSAITIDAGAGLASATIHYNYTGDGSEL